MHCIAPVAQVASCRRRAGSLPTAFDAYETIARDFPDNIECEYHGS